LSNSDRSRPAAKSANLGKAEDIPAALRDAGKIPANRLQDIPSLTQLPLGGIAIGLGILFAGGAAFTFARTPRTNLSTPILASAGNIDTRGVPATDIIQSPDVDNLLNHLSYAEAPNDELISIGGSYRLRKTAAAKFQSMVNAARSSGVSITTVSAFRSVEDQKRLFFGIGAERGQQPTKRAEVSAPPKYSTSYWLRSRSWRWCSSRD
jgi:zinc D-Ala-D-Ala carboxypeptidase